MSLQYVVWAKYVDLQDSTERCVLIYLCDSVIHEGITHPSLDMEALARYAVASEAAVLAALDRLATAGLISRSDWPWPGCWHIHPHEDDAWSPTGFYAAAEPAPPPAVPARRPRPVRTALYRHFDAADVLLYVGISVSPGMRFDAHVGTD